MSKEQKHVLIATAIIMIEATIIVLSLMGCSTPTTNMISDSENHARFQVLEKLGDGHDYDVIYVDTFTGVEYFVHHEDHGNYGKDSWGSVLFGADGLPILAPGYEREGGTQ